VKTPSALADYATEAELAAAIAELQDRAQALSSDLRKARVEARREFPLFDHKPRSRVGKDAARSTRKALPPEVKALVDQAEALARDRDAATRAANYLGWVNADLARATIIAATKAAVLDACPTFRAIIDRWRTALEGNGEKVMSARAAGKLAHREAQLDNLRSRLDKLTAGRG
jgi:hypothetical protein